MSTALFVIGAIIIAFVGFALELSMFWITVIVAAFAFVVLGGESRAKKKKLKDIQKAQEGALNYDPKTQTVILKRRHETNAKRFILKNYVSTRVGYTPEKLIFTSATVGGVTTGGVDKVGGYGTEQKSTDRYNVFFTYVSSEKDELKEVEVKKIALSDELLEQAKKSNIKKYLNGNKIIIVEPLVSSEDKKARMHI